jgi:molybdopterin biosynthesis enzyme MoaB
MEQTLTLLITVFRFDFRCDVLIISGKADEGPEDKKGREVMSWLEKVEVLSKLT